MRPLQKILAGLLLVLLAVTGYGWWRSDQAGSTPVAALNARPAAQPAARGDLPVIDQTTFLIAQRLALRATTPEEQPLAQQAVELADHELDLAFAGALRHIEAHPPVLSPEALAIQDRLNNTQAQLDAETARVKRLTDALARAPDSAKAVLQDELDLAEAQQELDQDEVTQANNDLMQAGGNVHQRIRLMQEQHEAAAHNRPTLPPATSGAFGNLNGLVGTAREWYALHKKRGWLAEAEKRVTDSVEQLAAEKQQLANELAASKQQAAGAAATPTSAAGVASAGGATPQASAAPGAAATGGGPSTLLTMTRRLAAEQNRLTIRDQRISVRKRLADTYAQWGKVVDTEGDAILHTGLTSVAVVLIALLVLLFIDSWLEKLLGRAPIDRRQVGALRSLVGVSLQIVGVVVILLMLIGVPGQIGTMVGLAGAGLTVALKDFIIGFLGWFVLMGRHGIRLGDWVEINGVSGEVIELGIFHTVLLETGNWTDPGHPTGRRVTFTNSFAIEGHYFNFSTTGQWLWDELSITVPYDRDPHAVAEAIRKEVTAATAENSRQAEAEWLRASRGQRGPAISAQPAIAERPAAGGVDIAVRYVTRATERFALRARLYQLAVQLLALRSQQTATP
ncbi:MAG TPA: mechanosensitive ion channel domain-containing protein [Steroidobacteraceae bacterium]|nr:mechanosensitive ion channel domain-containing protein [Steroidobacteraceae bacterium]